MAKHMHLHWKIIGATCGVLLLCLAGFNYFRLYCCGITHLSWSGGTVSSLRSEMALHICDSIRDSGVELDPKAMTTSESICQAIEKHDLDVGLVLGGFPDDAYKDVRQVATLGVEPLHLLVRSDLDGPASLELVRGHRVQLGERGTNGARLAEQFLCFVGMRPTRTMKDGTARAGDFEPLYWTETELLDRLAKLQQASAAERPALEHALPAAVLEVASLPSPTVDALVQTGKYQLVPLPYLQALHLDIRRNHGRAGRWLESDRVEASVIPAFTYGVRPAIPIEDCPTFGLQRLLVANKDVPAAAVMKLLGGIDCDEVRRYHIDLDTANLDSEFPVHPGAASFAAGRKPLVLSDALKPVMSFFSVAGAMGAGALTMWGFLRNLRAVNPEVHLRQIDRIERLLSGTERDELAPGVPQDLVAYLEGRLAQIKQAAIEDFAKGRFQEHEALVTILTLVADTRHLLALRRKQLCLGDSHTLEAHGPEMTIPTRPGRMLEAA
ncbi:MAG TPA: hypothetical protein VGM76_12560 [Lacipirellulaceae bacterium]|jgi:TRAP-type uncharacterized transport system substrate-binding protein